MYLAFQIEGAIIITNTTITSEARPILDFSEQKMRIAPARSPTKAILEPEKNTAINPGKKRIEERFARIAIAPAT